VLFEKNVLPYPSYPARETSFSNSLLAIVFLFPLQIVRKNGPAVLIVVAVHAQVFPVGTVLGIIPVVSIFMVHRQQVPIPVVELSTALGT
jgi:hypothetical protein